MKLRQALLVLASVVMLSLSRLPFYLGWLVFFAWIPLLMVLEEQRYRYKHLLLMGLIYATLYSLIVLNWIALVTGPGLFGIIIFYALYFSLLFYAMQRVMRAFPSWRYVSFAMLAVVFEYAQNFGETRFAWLNTGYSLADYNILIQAADLGGMTLLALLILAVNILLYKALRKEWKYLGWAALLLAMWIGYGWYCGQSLKLEKHDAGIFVMQPSIPQDQKWDETMYRFILRRYSQLTLAAKADSARLLIYPEAAMPVYLLRDNNSQRDFKELLDRGGMDIFTGFPDFAPAPAEHPEPNYYYNAATLFSQDRRQHPIFYKNILVPVGERMLWLDLFPFLWKLHFGQANWEFGTELCHYRSGQHTFSPSICYELAFADINHRMAIPGTGKSALKPKNDYLVNITNDAWFGTSYGPWLHAVMTRFRAVENRIQVFRSANTGISLIVDPMGHEIAHAGLFEIKNITAPLYTTPKVPLASRIRQWPMLLMATALIMFVWACVKKRTDSTLRGENG
jgi:apolipoprotein N-acyltransferase